MDNNQSKVISESPEVDKKNKQQKRSARCGVISISCLLGLPVLAVIIILLAFVVNPGAIIGYGTTSGDQFNSFSEGLLVVVTLICISSGCAAVGLGIAGNRNSTHRFYKGIVLGSIPLVITCLVIVFIVISE